MECSNHEPDRDLINIWYGSEQTFGINGNPQRQINILGNINSEDSTICAYFFLNDDTTKHSLTLGSDLHRLARKGDFNIEIERNLLIKGQNKINLVVESINGNVGEKTIYANYDGSQKWSLPYYINWQNIEKIQDVVEIVDGDWEITPDGIRTKTMFYDRILAFGDSTWKDYEVETTVVFHDFVIPVPGPPTYNVSHVAVASRWPGHDIDSLQPNRKWFPLGATSEFRLTSKYDSCRWRIFDGENFYEEQEISNYRSIQPDVKYGIKHRVQSFENNKTLYSVKLWKWEQPEPKEWDFQAVEESVNLEGGSACLIAHNTDVTFGNVSVTPIYNIPKKDSPY